MKKILVIDDEPALTEIVKMNLEDEGGFEVRTVNESLRAIPEAREFRPDLILLDLIMPNLSGEQLLALLREDKELAVVPVVIVSASTKSKNIAAAEGHLMGCTFIAKPVEFHRLIDCINQNIKKAA